MKTADTEKVKPMVYIVDDDTLVRRSINRLVRSEGLDAESFATAQEFLDKDIADSPACLIADVRMPELSGLDLYRKMIARGYNMPVIFITGFDTEETRNAAKNKGVVGYFRKPIDSEALIDTIRWALSKNEL